MIFHYSTAQKTIWMNEVCPSPSPVKPAYLRSCEALSVSKHLRPKSHQGKSTWNIFKTSKSHFFMFDPFRHIRPTKADWNTKKSWSAEKTLLFTASFFFSRMSFTSCKAWKLFIISKSQRDLLELVAQHVSWIVWTWSSHYCASAVATIETIQKERA